MAVKLLFPTAKPVVDFNFAKTKTLDPRITFTRASPATYYDGKTYVKAEENMRIQSATAPSQVEATKTDNAATTPSGYAACLLVPNTTTGYHTGGYQSTYVLAGLDYVFSFVTKASGYSKIRIGNASSGTVAATFDLVALTVSGTAGAGYVAAGIDDLGDDWRRCWVKANHSTSQLVAWSNTPFPDGATVDNYGRASFTGDGVSGAYFGEFQVEQRSAFTIHQPTASFPITTYQQALQTAPAGVPRFQHDPVTGKSLGFLSERQITNSMLWSEFQGATLLTDVSYSTGTFSEARMFGPDGTLSKAVRFPGSVAAITYVYKGTATASVSNTISVFVKMDDGSAPAFGSATPGNVANDFALVLGGTALAPTTYVVDALGNGVYRVSATATVGVSDLTKNGVVKYTANSTRGFRTTAWQLEANARSTSYCKVDDIAFVRSADLAIIDGTRLDSFYSQRGGTFVADCILSIRGTNPVFGMAFGNSIAERMNVFNAGNITLNADNYINGAASGGASVAGAVSDNQRHVIVRRCADYNWATCVNGGTVSTSASGQIGRKDRLGIGAPGYVAADRLDGPIARFAYYDELLTDAQVQALARV